MLRPFRMTSPVPFDSVDTAIQTIAAGGLVIVTDDEGRENEGDLIMAAEKATPELVNMMIRHARGLICVPMTRTAVEAPRHQSHGAAEPRSAPDRLHGVGGCRRRHHHPASSAFDRARTIQLLAHPETRSDQLVQPGHIFPLCSRPGGVLERAGHTEAAVDLAALAGLRPAAVICEILSEDGTMAACRN